MKAILFLFALLLFAGCNKNVVFDDFERLPENHRWLETDKKTFTFTVATNKKPHTISIPFSFVKSTEMNTFPLIMRITQPDGKTAQGRFMVTLKEEDCAGDICDCTVLFKEAIFLAEGKYTITFAPESKYGFVPNILGVGLIVKEKGLQK
jgi:hypothetical protein